VTTTELQGRAPAETVAELLDGLERRPDLAIEADLTVTLDGHTVAVTGYDEMVAVDIPSIRAARSLWGGLPVDRTDGAAVLSSIGLTVEIRVRGVPVARLGDDATPSRLATRLGLGPVELVPDGLLMALTRRRG